MTHRPSCSYLGLGLMSARLAILGGPSSPSVPGSSTELLSTCLPAEFSGTWEHADIIYTVKGQEAGGPAYEACRSIVEKVLFRKVMKASEAADVDFYAFSYYYDRAVDLGVIDEKRGGTIRVSDYVQAAQTVCSRVIRGPLQSPFLCLDLVYISVLLQELGLPPRKQLKLARTINQVETSWALGATFHYMETLKRP
uniref:Ectonucleoside triphosphate diphosphohydrolase 6 (Putative function) n=1 Tax=Nothobranchius kuhntae TaxID=321403 RepID=A0A1A8I7L2_NOTKU